MLRYLGLLLMLLLASCIAEPHLPLDCNEIASLREQFDKSQAPEAFRSWASETYQVPLDAIRMEVAADETYLLDWKKSGVWRSMSVKRDKIETIIVSGVDAQLTEILVCWGQPEVYRARYEPDIPGHLLSLDLIFPAHGLLAHGGRFFRPEVKQPPPVGSDFPMSLVRLVPSGTTDEVLHKIYVQGWGGANDAVVQQYKPWPEDWQSIVVDVDPDMRK